MKSIIFSESRPSKLPRTSRLTKNILSYSCNFFYDFVDLSGANPRSTENIWPSYTPAESIALISLCAYDKHKNSVSKLVLHGYETSALRYLFSIFAIIFSVFDIFFISDLSFSLRADGPSISECLFEMTDAKVSYFFA